MLGWNIHSVTGTGTRVDGVVGIDVGALAQEADNSSKSTVINPIGFFIFFPLAGKGN